MPRTVLAFAFLAIAVPAGAASAPAPAPTADIARAVAAMTPRLVDLRRDLHEHPELGNRETRTGALLADRLKALGLEVRYPVAKTGVVAVLRGGLPGPVTGLRSDIDALPIQERNDVPYKSQNPGVKHACGHDGHAAIVLGVAEVLSGLKSRLPGTVVFLFQPAEEGPPEGEEGGAPLMMKEGALDDPRVTAIYGLHMDPTLDVGTIGWSIGPIYASSDRFAIEVAGKKTHGAYPHTGLDPIPVAAEMVEALQTIVSRQIDTRQPSVLTIGSIHGGNRFNIIADQVTLEGTIRALDETVRASLKEKMARTVQGIAAANGTTATLRVVGDGNPATMNDARLAKAAQPALERVCGRGHVLEVPAQMGAEDFAHYAKSVPGLYLKMGVRNEAKGITAMIHTEDFDMDEAVLPLGVQALANVIWDHQAEGR
jgi:amidohydrolase